MIDLIITGLLILALILSFDIIKTLNHLEQMFRPEDK